MSYSFYIRSKGLMKPQRGQRQQIVANPCQPAFHYSLLLTPIVRFRQMINACAKESRSPEPGSGNALLLLSALSIISGCQPA